MTELVRPWRGMSVEERQSERRSRLVDSCLNVVGTTGVAATTVDRVCADARLTKRYFYESFADLDALLVEAVDDLLTALRRNMEEAIAHLTDPGARTHAVVSILIDVLSEDPRRARLYVESPGHPLLRRRRDEAIVAFTDFMATEVAPGPRPSISEERRLLSTRILVAGTTDIVTSWLAGDITATREDIIGTLEHLGAAV